jgi:hypothetical protein
VLSAESSDLISVRPHGRLQNPDGHQLATKNRKAAKKCARDLCDRIRYLLVIKGLFVYVSTAAVCAVTTAAVPARQTPSAAAPRQVLFIGDSFTYAQGGLDNHFARLAASASPPIAVSTARAVAGGAFLKVLWEMRTPCDIRDDLQHESFRTPLRAFGHQSGGGAVPPGCRLADRAGLQSRQAVTAG